MENLVKLFSTHRWMTFLVIGSAAALQGAPEHSQPGRNLNPYHEQQLQSQINKCASGVMACTDAEMRCLKQQELCQLLIRAERYDEALQVANNVYMTESANKERCAAHHFLMAEVYNRKMKASATIAEMEKNRQFALSAAQEVVEKKYPSKWGVSEHARALIRNLSDSKSLIQVRQRVASRQGAGDSAKEAIADAQRKYLDATQGRGGSAPSGSQPAAKFVRVAPAPIVVPDPSTEQATKAEKIPVESGVSAGKRPSSVSGEQLPSAPVMTRTVSSESYRTEAPTDINARLSRSGLLTSQPGTPLDANGVSVRGPVTVNGAAANGSTVDTVMQNNLAQLLESARKRKENTRRSPYATGELPTTGQ